MEKLNWSAPDLLSYSKNNLPALMFEQLNDSIGSISKRQTICLFHRDQFKSAYYSFLAEDAGIGEVFISLISNSVEMSDEESEMWIACTSHAVGYVQSAHAVIDTIAHAIYYAHGGESGNTFCRIREQKVSIYKIRRRLISDQLYTNLSEAINNLLEKDEFLYLNDLANLIKHRHLVPIERTNDQEVLSGRLHGMVFKPFTKDNGIQHEGIELSTFFEKTHEPIFTSIIDIGRELNVSLNLEP